MTRGIVGVPWASDPGRCGSGPGDLELVSLARAAVLVPVSEKVLWVEYLTLGGTAGLHRFLAHLACPQDDDLVEEHEIVVQTFTEVFADEGLPLRVV